MDRSGDCLIRREREVDWRSAARLSHSWQLVPANSHLSDDAWNVVEGVGVGSLAQVTDGDVSLVSVGARAARREICQVTVATPSLSLPPSLSPPHSPPLSLSISHDTYTHTHTHTHGHQKWDISRNTKLKFREPNFAAFLGSTDQNTISAFPRAHTHTRTLSHIPPDVYTDAQFRTS